MKSELIDVALRLSTKPDSKVKAFADVTLPLGEEGTVKILGFSVLESDSRIPRVMCPARKGKTSWFDVVELSGKVRQIVEDAVLARYRQETKRPEP